MTVKELFQIADPVIILYAYLMIEPPFDEYQEYDVQTKAERIEKVKHHLDNTIKQILESDYSFTGESEYTIFVMERTNMEIGKKYKKLTEAFLIEDRVALCNYDKDFSIWNDTGECKIDYYAFDLDKPETVAAYKVAEESVRHMGIETCCAAILNEICFWRRRISSDDLECEGIEEFGEKLEEAIKDIEAERVYSFATVKEFMEDFMDDYDWEWTEEEQQYREFYKEFKNSVKGLELSYAERISEEDHQRYIAAIKNEYQKRIK